MLLLSGVISLESRVTVVKAEIEIIRLRLANLYDQLGLEIYYLLYIIYYIYI